MRTKTWAGLAAAALVIAGGSYAYGATVAAPIASTTITSLTFCKASDGTMVFTSSTTPCPRNQTRHTLAGVAGPQGSQGVSGPAGPAGVNGLNGTNGTNGSNGSNGLDGAPGPVGPAGPAGLKGEPGQAGPQGVPGQDASRWCGGVLSSVNDGFNVPRSIATDGIHLWVVNQNGNAITELIAADGSCSRVLSGPDYAFERPYSALYAGGFVWVTNLPGSVTQIDPTTGAAVRVITGCGLSGVRNIAADSTHLWVTDSDVNAVSELNLSDGSCVATYSGSTYGFNEPYGVWSDGTHVWITNFGTTTAGTSITVLNASDGSVAAQLTDASYGFARPDALATDGKSMWVSNFVGNSLTQIDLNTFALIRVVSGLNQPDQIAIDGSHLWVPTYGGNTLVEFDAVSGATLNTFDAATYAFSGPTAPIVVGGYVYIANAKGNSLSRVPA